VVCRRYVKAPVKNDRHDLQTSTGKCIRQNAFQLALELEKNRVWREDISRTVVAIIEDRFTYTDTVRVRHDELPVHIIIEHIHI